MNWLSKILLLIIASSSITTLYYAQLDTLSQTEIDAMPENQNKIFALINKANLTSKSTPKKALEHTEEALKIALKIKDIRGEAYCYNSLGALYFDIGKFKKSVKYFKSSLTLFEGSESEKGFYSSTKNIAVSYEKIEDRENAIFYYEKFLLLAKGANNEDDIVYANNGLARCNQDLRNYKDSEQYYQTVYSIEQSRNNTIGQVQAAGNLGNFYEVANDTIMALNYLDSALTISQDNGLQEQTNFSYNNLNAYYGNRGNVEQQISFNEDLLSTNTATTNPKLVNDANLNLGKLNIQKNNTKEAITYLNNSINLSEEIGAVETQEKALEAITEAYEAEGDYENALKAYQTLVILKDSIQKVKNKQVLIAENLAQELEQKDEQIALLIENEDLKQSKYQLEINQQTLDNRQKSYVIYGLLFGMLILLVATILIIKSNRERSKANMLLELKSLRTQMNPHFIFNSLNSVNSFISKNDDRSANKYLSRFSQLMRLVLENSKHDFVSLESELKILSLYIELEHLRFKDKFEYEFVIPNDLEPDSIQIPPMLIQPYIENSVWHGLRYLDSKGHLSVRVSKTEESLIWIVEDNGIGRKESTRIKTENQKQGNSTGMKNIEQRLNILNKMNSTQMTAKIIDLKQGTKVEIRIPFKGY